MEDKQKNNATLRSFWESWMEATTGFSEKLNDTLNEPQFKEAMEAGLGIFPDLTENLAKSGLEAHFNLQKQFSEHLASLGKEPESSPFEDMDPDVFKVWKEMVERELGQFYKMPQIGITQRYQEHVNTMLDKFKAFQAATAELNELLKRPMQSSMEAMQEEPGAQDKQDSSKNARDYYQKWIAILESHYQTLLKSREYQDAMSKATQSMTEFQSAREALIRDQAQFLSIPTNKDMDELYKDAYQNGKKLKALEKRIEELEKKLRHDCQGG